MAVEDHKKHAPDSVRCMVMTVSDTRTEENDKSGKLMIDQLKQHGHHVVDYRIITDDFDQISQNLSEGFNNDKIDLILINGGTGVSGRDVTIEAVQSLIEKEIPGFGELFRMLSYTEDIGSAALMSRAIAGTKGKNAVFSTPGSSGAVRLAMEKLIVPEMGHVIRELNKEE